MGVILVENELPGCKRPKATMKRVHASRSAVMSSQTARAALCVIRRSAILLRLRQHRLHQLTVAAIPARKKFGILLPATWMEVTLAVPVSAGCKLRATMKLVLVPRSAEMSFPMDHAVQLAIRRDAMQSQELP